MKKKHGGKRKGAGRPVTYSDGSVLRSFLLPEKLNKKVKFEAELHNLSWSAMVVHILKNYFCRKNR